MAKIELGSGENMVRIGLTLTLIATLALSGTGADFLIKPLLWIGLIVLFLETVKLTSISDINGSLAEIVLSATVVVLGGKTLFSSLGKTFTEYHIFLILLLVGGLVILYGAYKKLSSTP